MEEKVEVPQGVDQPLFTDFPEPVRKSKPREVKKPVDTSAWRVLLRGIELEDLQYYSDRKATHQAKFNELTQGKDPAQVNAEFFEQYIIDRDFAKETNVDDPNLRLDLQRRLYLSGLRALAKAREEEERIGKLRNALGKVKDIDRKAGIERGINKRLKTMTNHRKRGLIRLETAVQSDPDNPYLHFALVQEYSDLEIRAQRPTSATGRRIRERINASFRTNFDRPEPSSKPKRRTKIA